jgi:hypothetical protein
MQTESPYWLKEAYAEAISEMDVGLAYRNQEMLAPTANLANHLFGNGGRFLDYGGGFGLFTRLMRDRGFEFFRQDQYCQNLFASYFDVTSSSDHRFDMLTAFEVFEHLEQPKEEIKRMFAFSDILFFSTEIQPETNLEDWWYLTPESGQHIAFYTLESFRRIAKEMDCSFYSNGFNLHLLSKKPLFKSEIEFRKLILPEGLMKTIQMKILRKLGWKPADGRASLMMKDFDFIRSEMKRNS